MPKNSSGLEIRKAGPIFARANFSSGRIDRLLILHPQGGAGRLCRMMPPSFPRGPVASNGQALFRRHIGIGMDVARKSSDAGGRAGNERARAGLSPIPKAPTATMGRLARQPDGAEMARNRQWFYMDQGIWARLKPVQSIFLEGTMEISETKRKPGRPRKVRPERGDPLFMGESLRDIAAATGTTRRFLTMARLVGTIPEESLERMIESENPPTARELELLARRRAGKTSMYERRCPHCGGLLRIEDAR
jgi:hypothetical protein